jgi:hypothetical protein
MALFMLKRFYFENSMSWNYRVVNKNASLGIHGVYYDESGKIIGMDQDPNYPSAEDCLELRTTLELMLEALSKPIVDYDEGMTKGSNNRNRAI